MKIVTLYLLKFNLHYFATTESTGDDDNDGNADNHDDDDDNWQLWTGLFGMQQVTVILDQTENPEFHNFGQTHG